MPPWFAAHLSRTGSGEYLDQLHGAHARDHPADPRAPGVCTCGVDARAHHQCQGVRTRSHAPQAGAPEAPHLARQSKGTRLPAPASCLHARARAAPPPSPLPCHPCARHRQFAPALGDAIAYPRRNGFVVNTRTTRTVTDAPSQSRPRGHVIKLYCPFCRAAAIELTALASACFETHA